MINSNIPDRKSANQITIVKVNLSFNIVSHSGWINSQCLCFSVSFSSVLKYFVFWSFVLTGMLSLASSWRLESHWSWHNLYISFMIYWLAHRQYFVLLSQWTKIDHFRERDRMHIQIVKYFSFKFVNRGIIRWIYSNLS